MSIGERLLALVETHRRVRINKDTGLMQKIRTMNGGSGTWVPVTEEFSAEGYTAQGIQHTGNGNMSVIYTRSPFTTIETYPTNGTAPVVTPPPPNRAIEVVDEHGTPRDMAWVSEKYGTVIVPAGGVGTAWRIIKIVEKTDDTAQVVTLLDNMGRPIVGHDVARHWPDAPQTGRTAATIWSPRFVIGATKENGNAEFGMGGGDYFSAARRLRRLGLRPHPPQRGRHQTRLLPRHQPHQTQFYVSVDVG
jgi:hypothetical protein